MRVSAWIGRRGERAIDQRPHRGIVVAVGSPAHGARGVIADRVSASLTAATLFLALAVVVTVVSRSRTRATDFEENARAADLTKLEHGPREALAAGCAAT